MDIQLLANTLEAALEPLLGALAIRVDSYAWGDPYSGHGHTDTITVELPRPDIGERLSVRFEFSFHELSGQCDGWKLSVKGARPEELAAVREVFAPAQYTGHWRNGEVPVIVVDGVEQAF